MSDLVPCQIQGIPLPTLDLDQLQDLFPDLDLEISINQMNVTIVTTWVTQQKIVSDVRIEMLHVDNLTKVEETITDILKDLQITGQTLDTGHLTLLHVGKIFQSHQCIQIYRQGISDKRRFSASHF